MDSNSEKSIIENVLLASIKEQRLSRIWRIFFRFLWLIIVGVILFLTFGINEKNELLGKHVAVVDLKGVINEDNATYKSISDGLNNAFADKDTVAVIIRANSPGGSPVYSDMLYHEIIRLKKKYPKIPIDLVAEEVCASGCYYIAAATDNIYASPASIVGSIGVIYTGFGATGLMQKLGIDSRLLISGKNKAMGYPLIPDNKEQDKMQQEMLDLVHNQFIKAVESGRGKRLVTTDKDLFSGRYWVGEQAIKLGLIDGFATVDTLSRDKFKTDNIVDFTIDQDPLQRVAKKFGVDLVSSASQEITDLSSGKFN